MYNQNICGELVLKLPKIGMTNKNATLLNFIIIGPDYWLTELK